MFHFSLFNALLTADYRKGYGHRKFFEAGKCKTQFGRLENCYWFCAGNLVVRLGEPPF